MIRSVVAMVALACAACPIARADMGDDPAELARTWARAMVHLPDPGGYRRVVVNDLPAVLDVLPGPISAVIYAHGCAGLDAAAIDAGRFLATEGYLVVAPDGFARVVKPASCDAARAIGGLHRAVLGWRQAELEHALSALRRLPGIDGARIALMGLSEGGITVATFAGAPVRARVIEGWTCHAGWPEYRGLNAPMAEPVLALVAAQDPWFKLPVLQGDCGAFMAGRSTSRSIVYRPPSPLASNHWLSFDPGVRTEILTFLASAGMR